MRKPRPVRNPLISGISTTVFGVVLIVVTLALLFEQSTSVPPFHYALGLPKAKHSIWMPEAERDGAITIGLQPDGHVFYRNDAVLLSDVAPRILADLSRGAERKIYLHVDDHAPYRRVKDLLESIHSTGIQEIAFLCKPSVL